QRYPLGIEPVAAEGSSGCHRPVSVSSQFWPQKKSESDTRAAVEMLDRVQPTAWQGVIARLPILASFACYVLSWFLPACSTKEEGQFTGAELFYTGSHACYHYVVRGEELTLALTIAAPLFANAVFLGAAVAGVCGWSGTGVAAGFVGYVLAMFSLWAIRDI